MLKKKLAENPARPVLGTWLSIGSPDVVDILKNLDFDWFVIDTEHSYISMEAAKTMLQVLGDHPRQTPLVRVGINDQLLIKKALDIGAQGIVVPLVNSAEEAERAVSYAMYPPSGVRGAAGTRASRYGMNLGNYLRGANRDLVVAVQLETTRAISSAEEILATRGVDIGFVGPTDLTMSLGLIDDRNNAKVIEAMQRVVKACEKHGKVPGTMAVSVEEARKWISLGFRFVSLASDAKHLIAGAQGFLRL